MPLARMVMAIICLAFQVRAFRIKTEEPRPERFLKNLCVSFLFRYIRNSNNEILAMRNWRVWIDGVYWARWSGLLHDGRPYTYKWWHSSRGVFSRLSRKWTIISDTAMLIHRLSARNITRRARWDPNRILWWGFLHQLKEGLLIAMGASNWNRKMSKVRKAKKMGATRTYRPSLCRRQSPACKAKAEFYMRICQHLKPCC